MASFLFLASFDERFADEVAEADADAEELVNWLRLSDEIAAAEEVVEAEVDDGVEDVVLEDDVVLVAAAGDRALLRT